MHTKDVIAETEGLYRLLADGLIGLRSGVQIDGWDAPHGSQVLRESFQRQSTTLRNAVTDNPPQLARVGRIVDSGQRFLEWISKVAGLLEREGRGAAADELKHLTGNELLKAVRLAIDEFLAEENRLDDMRIAKLRRALTRQNWILGFGTFFLIPVALVSVAVFTRGISGRLSALTENIRRLAEGKELAAPLTGKDEIARLARAFHEMSQSLEEKNRENELFIYSVSHDLRSPLVNMQGFSSELKSSCVQLRELLADDQVPPGIRKRGSVAVEQEIPEAVQYIQTAVSRMGAIIDSLLRLSRAGKVEYHSEEVDLQIVTRRILASLHNTITEHKTLVTVHPLANVWGDMTAIEQIFSNLIDNAVNYCDPSRPPQVEIGMLPEGETPAGTRSSRTYFIRDNGLGIPFAAQSKVFFAFQRFHAGASRGEGIGLALVRRSVERQGGRIRFESAPGNGTTFFVDLPTEPPLPKV